MHKSTESRHVFYILVSTITPDGRIEYRWVGLSTRLIEIARERLKKYFKALMNYSIRNNP